MLSIAGGGARRRGVREGGAGEVYGRRAAEREGAAGAGAGSPERGGGGGAGGGGEVG